jgi:hypothetical protein
MTHVYCLTQMADPAGGGIARQVPGFYFVLASFPGKTPEILAEFPEIWNNYSEPTQHC